MATLSTRQKDRVPAEKFAFPKERKEPLNDARHVRNAWRRIKTAAKKFGVETQVKSWRELMKGGKTGRR